MSEFIMQYWYEILLTLITTGALGFCKYLFNQIKNYKKLLVAEDQQEIINLIKGQIKPALQDIEELKVQIHLIQMTHELQLNAILRSYRFRLVQLCKVYLDQEYMTPSQFEQLSEFYKLYRDLGGNGQAQEYYEKTKDLPIKDE